MVICTVIGVVTSAGTIVVSHPELTTNDNTTPYWRAEMNDKINEVLHRDNYQQPTSNSNVGLRTVDSVSCNARTINDKIQDYQLTKDCTVIDINGNVVAQNCRDIENNNVYCAVDMRSKEIRDQDIKMNTKTVMDCSQFENDSIEHLACLRNGGTDTSISQPSQQEQVEAQPQFTITNTQWIYSGDNDSVLTFTVTNTGNTVLHVTSVHIGSEQYGKTFAYSTTIQPNNLQEVAISTAGVATAINTGNTFPFIVYTGEGVYHIQQVMLVMSEEEYAREQAAAEKAAKQQDLATPKSGFISIAAASLTAGSHSSVTVHNLLPNTCSGANWCNNVIIDYVYFNGQQMKWEHFPHWNLMADDSYTQNFYGVTENSGIIRVTGHVSDSGQQIFAEYPVA